MVHELKVTRSDLIYKNALMSDGMHDISNKMCLFHIRVQNKDKVKNRF